MWIPCLAQNPDYIPEKAYQFKTSDLNGNPVTLDTFKNKQALFIFGRTDCTYCRKLWSVLSEYTRPSDVEIFFVAVRQDADALIDAFYGKPINFELIPDPAGILSAKYGINRVPTVIQIDKNQKITFAGSVTQFEFLELLYGSAVSTSKSKSKSQSAQKTQLPRRFIVNFASEMPAKNLAARRKHLDKAFQRIQARLVKRLATRKNAWVVDIDPENLESLQTLPGFQNVKEDRIVRALLADSATQINADYAWDNAITGQGVQVCVIDTGIDYTHPDLSNSINKQYNFFDDIDDAMDDNGHGTHVAGIVASGGLTYRGISHDAGLMAAKALGSGGEGYASDVIDAINWCVAEGADVINLSLGEGRYSQTCDDNEIAIAANNAVDAGVVVVAAAGNDGSDTEVVTPACASKVIAVGALSKDDTRASYSDGGAPLDVCAPGGDQFGGTNYPEIVSCFSTLVANDPYLCMYFVGGGCYDDYFAVDGRQYIRAVGTSMATPHVAGAAALLLEANENLTPAQIKSTLEQTADDLGDAGRDDFFGWGKINIERALDNLPASVGELKISITDPNQPEPLNINEPFELGADVDCYGGDGCGNVEVFVSYCEGSDCNDFTNLTPITTFSTADDNPVVLGALSGITQKTPLSPLFSAETEYDISEDATTKIIDPVQGRVGSTLPTSYTSDDLEPNDAVGAYDEDATQTYPFTIPAGNPSRITVRMEHYLVLYFDSTPATGWIAELVNASGQSLGIIDQCIPEIGGGGLPTPPDCLFISESPGLLSALDAGGDNYLRITSFDVEEDEWLAFNNLYVTIDYQLDPNQDEVYRTLMQFDLSGIDTDYELTAARLNLTVTQAVDQASGQIYLTQNHYTSQDSAQNLHSPQDPNYTNLQNPIKSFSAETAGDVSINLKAAVQDALAASQDRITLQIRESGNDQLFAFDTAAALDIYQKLPPGADNGQDPGGETPPEPQAILGYDAALMRTVLNGETTKSESPSVVPVGSPFAAQFDTGNLEPEAGTGASGEDAQKVYSFDIPDGDIKEIRIRMENYFVLQWSDPDSGWNIYTSDPNGAEFHLIGECTPITGGGGEPAPPDCWFVSSDPAVLSDLVAGGTNYIKLISHDVGENDWLTFNALEVSILYNINPGDDEVRRYVMRFDLSNLGPDAEIDSAQLNLAVGTPADEAVGEVHWIESDIGTQTGAVSLYDAEIPDYASLTNPIKSFSAETAGVRKINVKSALEAAVEAGRQSVAFLIKEAQENQLFTLNGSGTANGPELEVHLQSSLHGGRAVWSVLPSEPGRYRLQTLAISSLGAEQRDSVVLDVVDPDAPVIFDTQIRVMGVWKPFDELQYSDTIEAIRVDAFDPQETPTVRARLINLPDQAVLLDQDLAFDDPNFIVYPNIGITESGQWDLTITAGDSQGKTAEQTYSVIIPWGRLQAVLTEPASPVQVTKNTTLSVSAQVTCLDGECADVIPSLYVNPATQVGYDDGSHEDYASLGTADGYLAVKLTPPDYPSRLKSVQFYVLFQAPYPFYLHVWDDNGNGGKPGTQLITPILVDPVALPSISDTGWLEIDLSNENLTVPSGDIYVGWSQVTDVSTGWIGFDMSSQNSRSYAYLSDPTFILLFGEWPNLDDLASLDPSYSGNIMIRGEFDHNDIFSGPIPISPAVPAYMAQALPALPDMKPNDSLTADFTAYVTGPVDSTIYLEARFANAIAQSSAGLAQVTIDPPLSECHGANLDATGRVNLNDLSLLASTWQTVDNPLAWDADQDSDTDIEDLAIIAEYWLSPCP